MAHSVISNHPSYSIRAEEFIPDPVPIEHRVAGISQALKGHVKVAMILQIAFQGLANDFAAVTLQLVSGRVQSFKSLPGPGR